MKKLFTCLGSSAISRFVYLNDRGPEGAAMNRPPVGPEAGKDKPEQKGMGIVDIGKRALEKVIAGAKALDASEKGKARMVTDAEAHIQELDMQIDEEQRELEDVQLRGGDVTAQQNIVDDLIRQKMAAEKGLRKVIDKAYGPAKAERDVPGPNQGLPKLKEKAQLTPDQKYDRMKQIFDKGKVGGVTLASLEKFLVKKGFLKDSDYANKAKFVTAIENLQRSVGANPDGIFGPATLRKVDGNKKAPEDIALIRGVPEKQREKKAFSKETEKAVSSDKIFMLKSGVDGLAKGETVLEFDRGTKEPGKISVIDKRGNLHTISSDLVEAHTGADVSRDFKILLEGLTQVDKEIKAENIYVIRSDIRIPKGVVGDVVYVLKRPKGEDKEAEKAFDPKKIFKMAKAGPGGEPKAGAMVLKVGDGKNPGEIRVMGYDEKVYTIKQDLTFIPDDEGDINDARANFIQLLEAAKGERPAADKATILKLDGTTYTGVDMSDLRPYQEDDQEPSVYKGPVKDLVAAFQKLPLGPSKKK
ncbi:MAG: hypothetical protein WCT53_02735 [Candidatus Gracilibacteria bacterium]